MMRDARINMIGEGANDVLRAFIALVGMRDVGLELEGVLDAISHPLGNLTRLGPLRRPQARVVPGSPPVPVRSTELEDDAARSGPTGRLARQQRRTAIGGASEGDRRPAVSARPHFRRGDRNLRQRLRPQPARPFDSPQPRRWPRLGRSVGNRPLLLADRPAAHQAGRLPTCGTTTTSRRRRWQRGCSRLSPRRPRRAAPRGRGLSEENSDKRYRSRMSTCG